MPSKARAALSHVHSTTGRAVLLRRPEFIGSDSDGEEFCSLTTSDPQWRPAIPSTAAKCMGGAAAPPYHQCIGTAEMPRWRASVLECGSPLPLFLLLLQAKRSQKMIPYSKAPEAWRIPKPSGPRMVLWL